MRYDLLEGVRVVEVGTMWAGPYAARILGDLGAEVIKVEGPRKPEQVRFGFYAGGDPGTKPWERGGHFSKFSRNKKSLILDLTQPRGRELLQQLLAKSDVLIENNTPRVRKSLGMGHDALAEVAPNLVVVSMPGFGDSGPYASYLAFGLNIEGFTGLTSVTGYADDSPPIRSAIPYGDPVGAFYGAMTAMLGLRERRRTGKAPQFELSQHEGLVSLLPDILIEPQVTSHDPSRQGNGDALMADAQDLYAAGEGKWIAVTVGDRESMARLNAVIGRDTGAGLEGLRGTLEAWATALGRDEAARQLQSAGVAAGPVLSPGEMMRNEQVVAREVYAPVEHPVAGTIPYSQLPLRFAGAHSEPDVHAPLFGQHNREIFGGLLGLSNEEIDGLYARGVTSDAPDMATPMSSASPQRPKP